jgi:transaldolase
MTNAYDSLRSAGVALWLDDLSREKITSGSLARMVEAGEIVALPRTHPSSQNQSAQGPDTNNRFES